MFTFLRSWWNSLVLKMTSWCKSQIFLSVFSYTEQTVDRCLRRRAKAAHRAEGFSHWGWDLFLALHSSESRELLQEGLPAHVPSTKESPAEQGLKPPGPLGASLPSLQPHLHKHGRAKGPHPSSDGQIEAWTCPNWTWIDGCQGIPPSHTGPQFGSQVDVWFGFCLGFFMWVIF